MPRKEDFGTKDYDIEEVVYAMPGSKVNKADDINVIIMDNDLMEVMVERLDPDNDPDGERVTVVQADADDQAVMDQFVQSLASI